VVQFFYFGVPKIFKKISEPLSMETPYNLLNAAGEIKR
jgi:hypothetical protein